MAESLGLSGLPHYGSGGTVHMIVKLVLCLPHASNANDCIILISEVMDRRRTRTDEIVSDTQHRQAWRDPTSAPPTSVCPVVAALMSR